MIQMLFDRLNTARIYKAQFIMSRDERKYLYNAYRRYGYDPGLLTTYSDDHVVEAVMEAATLSRKGVQI